MIHVQPPLKPSTQIGTLPDPEMRVSAQNLKAALKARGIEAQRLPFNDANPEAIFDSAQRVALELGESPLVLNATGGHKLMTLALTAEMEALAGDNLHLLYCGSIVRPAMIDWTG